MTCWFLTEAYSFKAVFIFKIKHCSHIFSKRCIKQIQNFSKLNNFRHSLELQKRKENYPFLILYHPEMLFIMDWWLLLMTQH